MKIKILIITSILFILCSCGVSVKPIEINKPTSDAPKQIEVVGNYIYTQGEDVYRVEDEEAGVVCWIFYPQMYASGISCLPKSQTSLK